MAALALTVIHRRRRRSVCARGLSHRTDFGAICQFCLSIDNQPSPAPILCLSKRTTRRGKPGPSNVWYPALVLGCQALDKTQRDTTFCFNTMMRQLRVGVPSWYDCLSATRLRRRKPFCIVRSHTERTRRRNFRHEHCGSALGRSRDAYRALQNNGLLPCQVRMGLHMTSASAYTFLSQLGLLGLDFERRHDQVEPRRKTESCTGDLQLNHRRSLLIILPS